MAVIEEFAKVCRPAAFQIFEANTGPAQVIQNLGTEEQKERWLPDIIAGAKTMAVGISEPDAGSAATDMRATATREAGGYRLNGTKRWISNGGEADQYLVYCRLTDDPGAKAIGAVVVDKGVKGFSFGVGERLMGFRGIPSALSSTMSLFLMRISSFRPGRSPSCSMCSRSNGSATPP